MWGEISMRGKESSKQEKKNKRKNCENVARTCLLRIYNVTPAIQRSVFVLWKFKVETEMHCHLDRAFKWRDWNSTAEIDAECFWKQSWSFVSNVKDCNHVNSKYSNHKLPVRINLPLFSTVLPSNSRLFLSCRPFVANTTFSTQDLLKMLY